jgi:hypothetical protein
VTASVLIDALRDLWGPGLVFVALCAWLVRRALRAARNESILEEQRLREAFGEPTLPGVGSAPTSPGATSTQAATGTTISEAVANSAANPSRASPVSVPPQLFRADVRGASQEHLDVLARLVSEREAPAGGRRAEIVWVRSNPTHVAWAELRPGNREVICVAQIDSGKVVARWQFG